MIAYMRTFLSTLLLVLSSVSLHSQDKTIELPLDGLTSGYDVYPMGKSGVLVVDRSGLVKSRYLVKQVYHLDIDLEIQNTFSIQMDDRYRKVSWQADDEGVYFLYQKRLLQNELAIMHVKPNGEVEVNEIPLFEVMDIKHFHVANGNVLIGGIYEFKPIFFLYKLENNRIVPIQGLYDRNVNLIQSRIHKNAEVMSIVTSRQYGQNLRQFTHTIRSYDLEGNFLRKVKLETPNGEWINSTVVSDFIGTEEYVIGSYTDDGVRGHTGMYIAKIKADGSQEYKFTPYFQLPGFYTQYSDKRTDRIKTRAKEKYEKKGKWSTSRSLKFYVPQMGNDKIFVTAVKDIGDPNVYQLAFDTNLDLVGLGVTPYQKNSTQGLLNQLNRDDLPIGLNWVHEDNFYFVSKWSGNYDRRWSGKLVTRIMNVNGVEAYESKIPLLFENRIHGLRNRGMRYWYGNRMLTSGRIYLNGSTFGEFVVTSWTLDAK